MNNHGPKLLLAMLAAFALVAVACGSERATDSPPASQPTTTPVSLNRDPGEILVPLSPITADLDSEPAAFLDAIPEEDRECLEREWGSDRYNAIRSGAERLDDGSLDVFRCISGPTWSRVMTGGLLSEVGELTEATQACIAEKLGEGKAAAIASRINDLDGEPTLEDFAEISIQMIVEIIPISFCLNAEERALFNGQSQFGETVSTLECLHDGALSVGLDFSSVFQISITSEEPPERYRQVAIDCGFVIPTPYPSPEPGPGGRGAGTPVSPGSGPEPMPILVSPTP